MKEKDSSDESESEDIKKNTNNKNKNNVNKNSSYSGSESGSYSGSESVSYSCSGSCTCSCTECQNARLNESKSNSTDKKNKNKNKTNKKNNNDSESDSDDKEGINNDDNDSEIKLKKIKKNLFKEKNDEGSDDDINVSEEERDKLKINYSLTHKKYGNAITLRDIFGAKITDSSSKQEDEKNEEGGIQTFRNRFRSKVSGTARNDFAIIFLEILLNNEEDLTAIFNRQKFEVMLENIKQSNNYFYIFKKVENNEYKNPNLVDCLKENKDFISKPILLVTLPPDEEKEVEFYKFGKTFSSSIRKRFGIIINHSFYSSKKPLDKFDENKSKNKTKYILNSQKMMKQNLEGNEQDYDKKDKDNRWHNEEKLYRIKIDYLTDKNKLSSFFIYCTEEKERDDIFQLIQLTQMKLTIKEVANKQLIKMENSMARNDTFYALVKIIAVKRKIKNKQKIKKYINKNILEKDKKKLFSFALDIKKKIKEKYIQQRKFFYKKGINRDMKHLILHGKFIKKKNDLNEKSNNTSNIDNISKAANTIYDILRKPYIRMNKKYRNNYISFKVKEINKSDKSTHDIDLIFNYNDACIKSIESNDDNNKKNKKSKDKDNDKKLSLYLDQEEIFGISNVIYNFKYNDKKSKHKDNDHHHKNKFNILILGPYFHSGEGNNSFNENNIYFDMRIPKNKNMKNAYDKIINDNNPKFDFLICQIFNCEISKNEIKNFYLSASMTENDFFFIKIIGGKYYNCSMQTKLFNPKFIKENIILLEFNIELIVPYEFFDNKKEEIKLILYHVPKLIANEKNLMDKILLDYTNKNEIKRLYLNLNMINNRSYESFFEQSRKSIIFWNLIPFYKNRINIENMNINKNYNYKKLPFYCKDFKIGNNFYYLENIDQDKISSLLNNKDIPSYYKYEKIDRYVQNLNLYHTPGMNLMNSTKSILHYSSNDINNTDIKDIKNVKGGLLNLCEYMGINENEEIYFHNLFTNEYNSKKYEENKFIIIQNNSFNIINNEEMYNFNKDTNEKFLYSFQWYKLISFKNENQMLSFLEILKKLRRQSVTNFFNTKNIFIDDITLISKTQKIPDKELIYGRRLNEDLLYDILKEDEQSKNNFNIIMAINKFEFKNDFNVDFNSDLNIEIISRSSESDTKNELNLFECFMNNIQKFDNNTIKNNPKIDSLKKLKTNADEKYQVCFTNRVRLNKKYFNKKNDKIINADSFPEKDKIIDLNIDLVKEDIIQINIENEDDKGRFNMYSVFNINKDIFNSFLIKKIIQENSNNRNYNYSNIYADFLLLPIYLIPPNENDNNSHNHNENIIGILTLKLICINHNKNNYNDIDINSYSYIYNKLLSDYIYICFKKGNNIYENGYYNDTASYNNELYERDEENGIINILGTYEPNIFRNVSLYKIYKYYKISLIDLINSNLNDKINDFFGYKGIKYDECIVNLNDYKSKYLANKFSSFLYKYKRNNFYYYFTVASWKNLLNNLSTNYVDTNSDSLNSIYYNFPSKNKLVNLFKKNDDLFYEIRNLIYMGLPNDISRKIIWDKLLNINDLVNKTAAKLSDFKIYSFTNYTTTVGSNLDTNEYIKEKGEIYILLNDITKNNFLEEYFSIMDTIIDLDIINLKDISNNDYNNFEIIKQIAKTFYQWTLLNIGSTSEANAINKTSEIKSINDNNFMTYLSFYNNPNEYCYYSGILFLCDKLFKYFKSPSETFWYLVGLSQVIPMFNINYNSYELSIYTLVIKLILEQHHINLYKKLISINFPFEYFISKHIASYYSSFFYDVDLFMKISDILVFESSIALNNSLDSINHLRFLCTITLTILVENENKFLSVDNIYQLDNLFKVLKFKTYNNQSFFTKIYNNITRYFINVDLNYNDNNQNRINNNNDENGLFTVLNKKWDNKRKVIEKMLDDNYYYYIRNNYKYMDKNFKDLSLIIHNKYIPEDNLENKTQINKSDYNLNDNTNRININIWKFIIRNYLDNHDEESKNVQKNVLSRGVMIYLKEIKILNFDNKNRINFTGKFNLDCYIEKGQGKKINKKILINEKGIIYNSENNSLCSINYKYSYKDNNYILFSLSQYNENGDYNNNEELFQFRINLNNINLLKPLRLEIHSHKSSINSNIGILELSILKYNDFVLGDDYCNLYLSLFSPTDYKIDNVINKKYLQINNFPKLNFLNNNQYDNNEEIFCQNIFNDYHEKLPLIYQYYLDRYFLYDNKCYKEKINNDILNEIKGIINELFVFNPNELYFIDDILKWFKEKKDKYNKMTIMEILIYLYLDNNLMNQNGSDILYNLFCFSSLNNKKNIVTISSLIELIYCLYKKYSIHFTYNHVKNMVNYFFQKEKYPSIKNVLICNFQDIEKIGEIIKNKNKYNIRSKFNTIENGINYIDITDDFIYVMSNFEEICQINDMNNKLDMNPQSKNNVVLIIKIILYDIFLNNNKNNLDYTTYDFVVIEYLKEYTNEEFYFSFEFNNQKGVFDVSFIDNDKKYNNQYNYQSNNNLTPEEKIYESILFYSHNNFLFNNSNNDYIEYDISFYEFKKLFFSLPYLNDLLWKNCYKLSNSKININEKNIMKYKSKSNKNIIYDRVSINIINNDKKIVQFIFVSDMSKNLNYNSNFSHNNNSIVINYNVYSNIIIKRLYDMVINKLQYQNLNQYFSDEDNINIQMIKDSLSDFKNILFYSINNAYNYNYSINHYNNYLDNNSKYHFLDPLLPLYINFNYSELKHNSINFNIDIAYSFWKKNNNYIKNRGYAKYPLNNGVDFYQWRKCLIQISIDEEDKKSMEYKIIFDCFNEFNKFEKKLKKLKIMKNNDSNTIVEEVNNKDKDKDKDKDISSGGDNIIYNGENSIGTNILINRNNNYKCL